jgi:hypothetical protein
VSDVRPPSNEELARAGRIWAALLRREAEGLLVMTQWFSVDHQGSEVIKLAALSTWDKLGIQLQAEIVRTLQSLQERMRS